MTNSTPNIPILDDDAIAEIEGRLTTQWCQCGHTKDSHGFFSDHDECYECDQASPDLCCEWRPAPRENEHNELQSQLEQVTKERDRLIGEIAQPKCNDCETTLGDNWCADCASKVFRERAIAFCRDKAAKYTALANDSLPNDQTGARLAASARTLEEFAAELEQLK